MGNSGKFKKQLLSLPLFRNLGPKEVSEILPFCETREIPPKGFLFKPGQDSYALFYIEKGSIDISKDKDDHQQAAKYICGKIFNIMDIFSENKQVFFGIAQEQSKIISFPGNEKQMKDFAREKPHLKAKIMKGLMESISTRIRETNQIIQQKNPMIEQLTEQLYCDSLTGVKNDIYLRDFLEQLTESQFPMALYISKPDNFKSLNDSLGHEAGDRAIVTMARTMDQKEKELGFIARYMGNAMAFVLPHCSPKEAMQRAELIQKELEGITFQEDQDVISLQFSVGYCYFKTKKGYHREEINHTHQLPLEARKMGGRKILNREPLQHDG